MKRSELLRRLAKRVPEIVAEEYGGYDEGTCIPASYHALEVLQKRGVPCRLASMDAIAMNAAHADWIGKGQPYPMPPTAWSVGLTHNNPDREGYLSHLVVKVKGRILDCAAGQLSRPWRDMEIPPGVYCGAGGCFFKNGAVLMYRPSPEPVPRMWRNAPTATRKTRERLLAEFAKKG